MQCRRITNLVNVKARQTLAKRVLNVNSQKTSEVEIKVQDAVVKTLEETGMIIR